nr:MAG TPA: hypothetical protein [Caudoviricetes sp.]
MLIIKNTYSIFYILFNLLLFNLLLFIVLRPFKCV